MRRYMKNANPKHLEKFLSALFSERDPFALRFLDKVFLHFKMDFSPVPTIRKSEAQQIQTPIYLFTAEKDIIFPGKSMQKRAAKLFPNLQHNELLSGSNHVLSRAHNDYLQHLIIESRTVMETEAQ